MRKWHGLQMPPRVSAAPSRRGHLQSVLRDETLRHRRHYCSRHLICIVLFTRRGPSLHGRCPASFGLRLTSSSDRTPAHRSRTTLRFVYVGLRPRSGSARTTLAPPSERPDGRWISAILTVRRLLYGNDSFHSFSSAEFCSAYLTL